MSTMTIEKEDIDLNVKIQDHQELDTKLISNDEFIQQHLDFVESIASKTIKNHKIPSCIDFGDLVNWGIEGLIKAKLRFTPKHNAKFTTYAYYRIKGEILDCIKKEWKYRVPKDYQQSKKKFKDQLSDFILDNLSELNKSNLSSSEIEDSLIQNSAMTCFITNDLTSATGISKGMKDPEVEQVDESFEGLWNAISDLTNEEKNIIKLYYVEGLKQYEIANYLKWSSAKVSRTHLNILNKLKKKLNIEEIYNE